MSTHAVIPNPLLERVRGLASGGRIRVRCFTAGPNDRVRPNFESELHALLGAHGMRRFTLEISPLTEAQTFIKALRRNSDEIIHIACHGSEQSLCFLGQNNDSRQVDSDWMIDRFEHARSVKLVVLNACDSASIATAIAESPRTAVLAAIGYVGVIDEFSLCEFTNAFYSALAEGLTVKRAFDDAKASLECKEAARQLRLSGLSDFSLLYNHLVPPALLPWLAGFFLGALLGPVVRRLLSIAALALAIALVVRVAVLPPPTSALQATEYLHTSGLATSAGSTPAIDDGVSLCSMPDTAHTPDVGSSEMMLSVGPHSSRSKKKRKPKQMLMRDQAPMASMVPTLSTTSCRAVQRDISVQRCVQKCVECSSKITLMVDDDGALFVPDEHNASVLQCLQSAVSRVTRGRPMQKMCVLHKDYNSASGTPFNRHLGN